MGVLKVENEVVGTEYLWFFVGSYIKKFNGDCDLMIFFGLVFLGRDIVWVFRFCGWCGEYRSYRRNFFGIFVFFGGVFVSVSGDRGGG